MKKTFASVLIGLALGAVSAVSALDMSVGVGGFFSNDFGGGADINLNINLYGVANIPFLGEIKSDIGNVTGKGTLQIPYHGGGAHLFFDLTYAEVSVGYFTGGGVWTLGVKLKQDLSSNFNNVLGDYSTEINSTFSTVDLGLLGKYPIAVSDKITLFPAVGIDYRLCFSGESKYDLSSLGYLADLVNVDMGDLVGNGDWEDDAAFSALFFKLGAGLDFKFSERLFIRSEFMYGVRLESKAEEELINRFKTGINGLIDDQINDIINNVAPDGVDIRSNITSTSASRLGHGLTVKLGVGFKL